MVIRSLIAQLLPARRVEGQSEPLCRILGKSVSTAEAKAPLSLTNFQMIVAFQLLEESKMRTASSPC
jgi:hypothetical protein